MKSNSLTVSTSQRRELVTITIRNPFTWENVAAFYRRALPSFLDFNRATVQDAKFLTEAIAFTIFFGCVIFFIFPLLLTILR
ncbi:hypothetical protein [Parabacteroides provencensis]|uniref:hypothetical protein n=1 Tax=Parabacteroides provencensis TaxID=1944636 RepID=UPI000C151343|nr:hypothetical protein [Parabacteroides provencensis]